MKVKIKLVETVELPPSAGTAPPAPMRQGETMKGWLILWNLWRNCRNKNMIQKLLTLKSGTNGRTPEPQKISRATLKNGKSYVTEKPIACGLV